MLNENTVHLSCSRRWLQNQLAMLEWLVEGVILLVEKCIDQIQGQESQVWLDRELTELKQSLRAMDTLTNRCLQRRTGLCVVCQKYSRYQSKIIAVLCASKDYYALMLRKYHHVRPEIFQENAFDQVLSRIQEEISSDLENQDELDLAEPWVKMNEAPSQDSCGCIQLPREALDILDEAAMNIVENILQ